MVIRIIIFTLMLINLCGCGNYVTDHIEAYDNGQGKAVRLLVKPDQNGQSVLRDENNNIALKWNDTGLIVSNFASNQQGISIGLFISGRWYPFGSNGTSKQCDITTCGQVQDIRCNNLPSDTKIVNPTNNQGCYLSNGQGVYMLIAKQDNDVAPDPNINPTVANSPNSADGFYTAHLSDFPMSKDGLITVDKMWECDDNSSVVSCNPIPMSKLIGGKIYLKVYDGYYSDNSADLTDSIGNPYVLINVETGVLSPNFVSEAITIIISTIDNVCERINKSLIKSLRDIAFVIILMYVAFTGFSFMTGLSKITQTEAVIRLLKISIVLMFLTPNNIIAEGFTKIYQELANFSSNIIIENISNTPIPTGTQNSGNHLEDNLNYLKFYDGIINQILSKQVHIKLIALLFTINFWLIPFMYVLIVMIIFIVLRSLLLYIAAYMQIAFLILILPILVPTLLFQVTADLFQNWLKYMANSALLIVIATTGFGLVLNIMVSNFSNLISYSVSKTWWWFADSDDAVSAVLNFKTYILTFMNAFICYAFVEVAPKLADALSESQMSPSFNAFNSLWGGMSRMMNEGISGLKSINNQYFIGRLMDQSYKTDGKYDKDKEGKGIVNQWRRQRNAVDKFYERNIGRKIDKINKEMNDNSIISLSDPYKDQAKKDELTDLRQKNAENKTTFGDYKEMIDSKKKDYLDEVKNNAGLITSVTTLPDGDQIQLNQDVNKTIMYNDHEIDKDEIRKAIVEGRDAKSVDGGLSIRVNLHEGNYNVGLNDTLKRKLQELDRIEKDYGFVKRK